MMSPVTASRTGAMPIRTQSHLIATPSRKAPSHSKRTEVHRSKVLLDARTAALFPRVSVGKKCAGPRIDGDAHQFRERQRAGVVASCLVLRRSDARRRQLKIPCGSFPRKREHAQLRLPDRYSSRVGSEGRCCELIVASWKRPAWMAGLCCRRSLAPRHCRWHWEMRSRDQ